MQIAVKSRALFDMGDLPEREEYPILAVDLADSCMELADLSLRAGDHENAKNYMEQAGTYLRNTRSLFWDKNVYREAVKKYNTKAEELSEVGIDLQPLEM